MQKVLERLQEFSQGIHCPRLTAVDTRTACQPPYWGSSVAISDLKKRPRILALAASTIAIRSSLAVSDGLALPHPLLHHLPHLHLRGVHRPCIALATA